MLYVYVNMPTSKLRLTYTSLLDDSDLYRYTTAQIIRSPLDH